MKLPTSNLRRLEARKLLIGIAVCIRDRRESLVSYDYSQVTDNGRTLLRYMLNGDTHMRTCDSKYGQETYRLSYTHTLYVTGPSVINGYMRRNMTRSVSNTPIVLLINTRYYLNANQMFPNRCATHLLGLEVKQET